MASVLKINNHTQQIYEYMLILSPHEDLRDKVMRLKQAFYDTYKAEAALWAKPHITLVRYRQFEMSESRIISRLQQTAMRFAPVRVHLQGFGGFPCHTIYINIADKIQVRQIVTQIRTDAQRLMKPGGSHKPHFITEPHLSIAHQLQPRQYELAWQAYQHKHFSGSFIADAMLLLKRPAGRYRYEILRRFDFQNLPVGTAQGNLFQSAIPSPAAVR